MKIITFAICINNKEIIRRIGIGISMNNQEIIGRLKSAIARTTEWTELVNELDILIKDLEK
jgi:hypothetical protein